MKTGIASLILGIAAGVTSCGPNQRILESAQENRSTSSDTASTNSSPAGRTFDHDLTAMRNADFNFIYVFRRRDGAVLTPEDKTFVSDTTPWEMNRKTLSDEGRAVVIGSNFKMGDDLLKTFKSRFAFEDYSKPLSEVPNSNTSSNR